MSNDKRSREQNVFIIQNIFQTVISELSNSSSPNQQKAKWFYLEQKKEDIINNYDMTFKNRGFDISYPRYYKVYWPFSHLKTK